MAGNSGSQRHTVNSGVSLLLLLLVVMCLVSFASLSLVSAQADSRLSEKYAEQVSLYHEAHREAQRYLRDLNAGNDSGEGIQKPGENTVTVSFPAGEHMQLTVVLKQGEGTPESGVFEAGASGSGTSESGAWSALIHSSICSR